jgi:hypothetical protein
LPKFSGNNVVTAEEHIDQLIGAFEIMCVEHDDVAMKLFSISLEGPARTWYLGIVDNTITSYTDFETAFKNRWGTKKDHSSMLNQFNTIKKKENETVREFNARFDTLRQQIPTDVISQEKGVLITYLNAYEGQHHFYLRRSTPQTLAEAMESAISIEEDLNHAKVEPMSYPRAKRRRNPKKPTPLKILLQQSVRNLNR